MNELLRPILPFLLPTSFYGLHAVQVFLFFSLFNPLAGLHFSLVYILADFNLTATFILRVFSPFAG